MNKNYIMLSSNFNDLEVSGTKLTRFRYLSLLKLVVCAIVVFSIVTSSMSDVIHIAEGSSSGYEMTDGNTYVIDNSVSFTNSIAGGSGITIASNATVVVYVPKNVTLSAIGANGSGQIGGGAGICVPETATLVITGEGTVNATGGNAGNGENGANGSNGGAISCSESSANYYGKGNSGAGGKGGAGGGGAGAAIGGCGAYGGVGGDGGVSRILTDKKSVNAFCGNGNDGQAGCSGQTGGSMGICYVLGH